MHKTLTALAAVAALTFAVVAAPQQADARWLGGHGHGGGGGGVAAGILGGLAAGAILGGIAANQGYYGSGYYDGPVYYGSPGYYGPGAYYGPGPYAYEGPPISVRPAPRAYRGGGCWIVTDSTRGYGFYGPCR
jgi:hypothetical protein